MDTRVRQIHRSMKVWMLWKVVKLNNMKHTYGTLLFPWPKLSSNITGMLSQHILQFLNYKYFLSDSLENGFLKWPHSTIQFALTFPALLATYPTNLILHSTYNFTILQIINPLLCSSFILLLFMSKNYSQHPALKHPHSGKPMYTNVIFHSLPDT